MSIEVDHVFVCCAPGAPEADALLRIGLREGSGNVHRGQGTANRRFFFHNAYLELLWVADSAEARGEATRRTRLWERWEGRMSGACPFGILFRPGSDADVAPFPTWSYRPGYLPPGATIEFAQGVALEEPELAWLSFARNGGPPAGEPTDHVPPLRRLVSVSVGLPAAARLGTAARAVQAAGAVAFFDASEHALELRFDCEDSVALDLRPALPLVLRGR